MDSGHWHSGLPFAISGGYVEHQWGTTQSTVEPGMESIVEPGMESIVEPGMESIVEPGMESIESAGGHGIVSDFEPSGRMW
jgi:Xaa-Pro aminopeptidase